MTEEIAQTLVGLGGVITIALLLVVAKRDAVMMVMAYLVLLLWIPAVMVIPGMGAVGGPATLFGLILFAWWICGVIIRGLGFVRANSRVKAAMLFFCGIALLSYAFAAFRLRTKLEMTGADRDLITLIAGLGVFLVACDGLRERYQLHSLAKGFVNVVSAVGLIAVIQFATKWDPLQYLAVPGLVANSTQNTFKERSDFLRPYSTTEHPIELAVLMGIVVPIALYLAMDNQSKEGRMFRWARVGVLVAAILTTVSRSGLLGLAVGLLVMFFAWSWRVRLNAIAIGIVGILVVSVVVRGLVGTLIGLFAGAGDDPSIAGRLEDFAMIRELLPDTWLIGLGLGSWSKNDYFILDNEFLRTMMEQGIIGVFALSMLVCVAAVGIVRTMALNTENKELGRSLLAAILVMVVSMLTFDALDFFQYRGVFYFLLGLCAAYIRLEQEGDAGEAPALVPRRPMIAASQHAAIEAPKRPALSR